MGVLRRGAFSALRPTRHRGLALTQEPPTQPGPCALPERYTRGQGLKVFGSLAGRQVSGPAGAGEAALSGAPHLKSRSGEAMSCLHSPWWVLPSMVPWWPE